MPAKKYIVELSSQEREELTTLVNKGKAAAYKRKHAEVLLKADQSNEGPGWSDKRISETFDVGTRTVERIRQTTRRKRITGCHRTGKTIQS